MKKSLILAVAAFPLFLVSCAAPTHKTSLRQASPVSMAASAERTGENQCSYWSDHGLAAPLQVRIDLSEQTAYFYRGEVKIGQSRVATGRSGHATPTGSFTISEKVVAKRSSLYGRIYDADGNLTEGDADTRRHSVPRGGKFVGSPMPYWMRLTSDGIGMHVGPIPNPGSPASAGCVRMPREMARTLYEKVRVGTKVTIVR